MQSCHVRPPNARLDPAPYAKLNPAAQLAVLAGLGRCQVMS